MRVLRNFQWLNVVVNLFVTSPSIKNLILFISFFRKSRQEIQAAVHIISEQALISIKFSILMIFIPNTPLYSSFSSSLSIVPFSFEQFFIIKILLVSLYGTLNIIYSNLKRSNDYGKKRSQINGYTSFKRVKGRKSFFFVHFLLIFSIKSISTF